MPELAVGQVEKLLAEPLGKRASSINKWRQGERLPRPEDVAQLARTIHKHADKDRAWVAEFLQAGAYEEAEALLDELFPAPPQGPTGLPLPPEDASPLAFDVPMQEEVAPLLPAAPDAFPDAKPRRKVLATVGLVSLALLLLLIILLSGQWYSAPNPTKHVERATSTLVKNGSFELSDIPEDWGFSGQCESQVEQGAGGVAAGDSYLTLINHGACSSFYQDITLPPDPELHYTVSAWVRSRDAMYPLVEMVVWPLQNNDGGLQPTIGPDKVSMVAQVYGSEWQCIQNQFTVQDPSRAQLRLEFFLQEPDNAVYFFDNVQVVPGAVSLCPVQPEPQLHNASFEEQADSIQPWRYEDSCSVTVGEGGTAQDGRRYLEVARELGLCASFYQDLQVKVEPGEEYRFHIWVRSTGAPREGHLAMWAKGGTEHDYKQRPFRVDSQTWQCVEVSLPIQRANHTSLRAEVYLDMADGLPYHLDNAGVTKGETGACPPQPLHIDKLSIETRSPHYVGAGVGVTAEIVSEEKTLPDRATVKFWLSENEDGNPINLDMVVEQQLFPRVSAPQYRTRESYVLIPLGLDEGLYYLIAEMMSTGQRTSVPITVSSCFGSTIFCDVDVDTWAHEEIELWAENRLTGGCQPNSAPYNNRPFCTQQVVPRFALAVVLVTFFEGGGFKPALPPQGYYADVKPDSLYATYIEYLYQQGFSLPSDDCPQTGDTPNFCPNHLVSRAEMARYLTDIFDWELDDVEIMEDIVDLPDDPQTRRAISFMLQHDLFSLADPGCPRTPEGPRICPDAPVRRDSIAYTMMHLLQQGYREQPLTTQQ